MRVSAIDIRTGMNVVDRLESLWGGVSQAWRGIRWDNQMDKTTVTTNTKNKF